MTLSLDRTHTNVQPAISPIPLLRSSDVAHAERLITTGTLVRVRRGVLTPRDAWLALKPWERYAARVQAVALTHPGVVFCNESAAACHGLPIFGDPIEVHVLDTPGATSRRSGGIRVHTTGGDRSIVDTAGTFATTVTSTVIDIARSRTPALSLAVADAALRRNPEVTVEMLVAENESRASTRGRRLARWSLHRATPVAETPLESVSRAAIEWLGFEDPELQMTFETGGITDRSDMWWATARVIGEADGEVKYDGSIQDPIDAIRREKERDRRLRNHASALAHWGWADVARVAPLRQALRDAGLCPIRPESSPQLQALGALLTSGRRSTKASDGGETATERRNRG